jgi:hypothetical protein
MSKKPKKSVTIKMNRDGSITMRSTGGVDLRKIVPSLFKIDDERADPAPPSQGEASP